MIASSKRGERRLLSVLLGSSSEAARAQESQKLLNWGYQFFDSVKLQPRGRGGQIARGLERIAARGQGRLQRRSAGHHPESEPRSSSRSSLRSRLVAPVAQGQRVGTLRVTLDGKPWGEYPLVALEAVPEAGIFRRAWDTLRLWLK